MYTPEEWELVKIGGTDPHWRVFGGWRGGFADGDRWKLNSGIMSAELDDDGYWLFHGYSGSTYRCHPNGYGIRGTWLRGVLEHLCSPESHMTLIPNLPDIASIKW